MKLDTKKNLLTLKACRISHRISKDFGILARRDFCRYRYASARGTSDNFVALVPIKLAERSVRWGSLALWG